MNQNTIGGILLILIGVFLGFITYKKYSLFWNIINTRLLRKLLGDTVTSIILYIVSIVLIVTGVILTLGFAR
ncbi:hypothetical protein [Defluviitalea saccharophila]|uniref:Uncharacterized protein n=1 Tax=Defluviitalea saccharophila TaxID=879970 RepID=A0ABZ2Y2N1_9FIRM|nr:hypothetical protein [Candidatus Epulonipiscium sp.]